MNTLFIILTILCALVGIIGSIIPGLPGPPISWVGLLLLNFTDKDPFSTKLLVIYAIVAILITILDYIVPILGTKRYGGTKAGAKGSTWGLIVSVFVLPILGITLGPLGLFGILGGPFVGAYLGEKWRGNSDNALRSAWGSFMGFLAGTFIKLVYTIVVAVVLTKALF